MPGTDMLDNFMQSLRSALPDTMLEDTIVMAITGISVFWILATRITFALIVVWTRKAMAKVKRLKC